MTTAEYNDKMELNVKFSSDISFIASDACDRYLLQMYIAKGIQEAFELVGSGCNHFTELYLRTAEQTLAFDDVAPPVKHGKWLKRDDMPRIVECKCSICGYADYPSKNDRYWFERNYCPNCGAKMEV